MRIIFMGTPDFAVPSLDILVQNGCNVVAVITAVDKPAGRGKKLQQSPVKKYALSKNIPVLQPPRLKRKAFLEELASYKADLQVVVAFRILPEQIFNMPPMGTFNLHGSILPQYRGAAPINWAVMNGEKESGVSTFFLKKKVDTGNILFIEKTPIGPDTTAGELHDSLMQIGAKLVLKTVKAIESGDYKEKPQKEPKVSKPAPKIFKEDCRIDWNRSVDQIHNHIRGLSPYPTAFSYLMGQRVKIFKSSWEKANHEKEPATLQTDSKSFLRYAAADGWINILELQMPGKKRMAVKDFLRGFRFI